MRLCLFLLASSVAATQPPLVEVSDLGEIARIRAAWPLLVSVKGGRAGYVDHKGELVVERVFDAARPFNDGVAVVRQGGRWGAISDQGEVLIQPRFDELGDHSEGRLAFRRGERWGVVDVAGELLVEPTFKSARAFREGRAVVEDERERFGYIDKAGVVVVEPRYGRASNYAGGFAIVSEPGAPDSKILDARGAVVGALPLTTSRDFSDGLVAMDGGYFDTAGRRVIEGPFASVTSKAGSPSSTEASSRARSSTSAARPCSISRASRPAPSSWGQTIAARAARASRTSASS